MTSVGQLRERAFARPLIRRLGRYGAVSAVTSVVVFVVLGTLVGVVEAPAGWSNVVATLVGVALSFELNRRWAWEGRGGAPTASRVGSFVAINLAGLVVSTAAVHVAATMAIDHHFSRLLKTATVEGVNVAAWGALWLVQFTLLDRVLFRDRTVNALTVASGSALGRWRTRRGRVTSAPASPVSDGWPRR